MSTSHQRILILDLGSPYTQLIARSVRAAGVFCEILPGDCDPDALKGRDNLRGIILSDSPLDAQTDQHLAVSQAVFSLGVPVLGIGHGMLVMAQAFGAPVAWAGHNTYASHPLRARGHTRLLDGIEDSSNDQGHGLLTVWLKQGSRLTQLPDGFSLMASTEVNPIAGVANETDKLYGIQFLPELAHTPQGQAILARFVREICGCDGDWTMSAYIDEAVEQIRQQVGQDQVLLGLSGGVDSSVAAALIHKAIGNQLTCVFVDHGLLRLHEADQVMETLGGHFGMNIVHVNAADRFLNKLAGVSDPEDKRKIIGKEFVEVFQEEAGRLNDVRWLAQGTIYPDVIESAASRDGKVAVKSHHNVGGLPETLNLQLLEPLRDLFKHEVRDLGLALGLSDAMVFRHPFPGPGLGVRILGEIKAAYADILRQADAIFINELRNTPASGTGGSWYDATSQAFAVFLPVKSVGTVNEQRRYDYVIALRAIQTVDFMNARIAELPYSLLERVSTRIIKELDGISRVVYDISGKPPATIEWE